MVSFQDQFLEPEEFCGLLLSRRQLVRFDKMGANAYRLLDETSGEVFDIEETKLDQYVEKQEGFVSLFTASRG